MASNNTLTQQVLHNGWGKVALSENIHDTLTNEVQNIASAFGDSISNTQAMMVEQLSPRPHENGRPISLSAKYGLGAFPLHCDTAHWTTPCRYIVLACLEPSIVGAATVLLDTARMTLSAEERLLATTALFSVRNGRRSFYATILSPSRKFVRVDRGCMEPTSGDGRLALGLYEVQRWESELVRINWQAGDVLVVDNWRVLHGRDAVRETNSARKLMRVLVR